MTQGRDEKVEKAVEVGLNFVRKELLHERSEFAAEIVTLSFFGVVVKRPGHFLNGEAGRDKLRIEGPKFVDQSDIFSDISADGAGDEHLSNRRNHEIGGFIGLFNEIEILVKFEPELRQLFEASLKARERRLIDDDRRWKRCHGGRCFGINHNINTI